MTIQAISSPKEQPPNRQKTTTGRWQHYKDSRRGMSNLHNVTCPRLHISGCQPAESEGEKARQAGCSLWLGRQRREPCSPFNNSTNHSFGTLILFHFSVAPSLPRGPWAKTNQKLLIPLQPPPGETYSSSISRL